MRKVYYVTVAMVTGYGDRRMIHYKGFIVTRKIDSTYVFLSKKLNH